MFEASETHHLPLETRPGADHKPGRPFLLLHDCPVSRRAATFAYGSRQSTLADGGGAHVLIDRGPSGDPGYSATGLSSQTYFYPCRLRPEAQRNLRAPLGRIDGTEMGAVREQLRTSLGLEQGTNRSGAARHTWRGLFVELHAHVKRLTMATYALVVTDPAYARKRSYQHLIPLVDAGAGLPLIPGSLRVEKEWLKELDASYEAAYLVVPSVFSGSERNRPEVPGMIVQPTSVCVDDETIGQVEDALVAHFDL